MTQTHIEYSALIHRLRACQLEIREIKEHCDVISYTDINVVIEGIQDIKEKLFELIPLEEK